MYSRKSSGLPFFKSQSRSFLLSLFLASSFRSDDLFVIDQDSDLKDPVMDGTVLRYHLKSNCMGLMLCLCFFQKFTFIVKDQFAS